MRKKMRNRGVLYRLFFNRADERAYGRFAFFFDGRMQSFSGIFANGVFYTAFLRLNNISMSDVGIMTYMPIFANLSCIFSPFIFRNMKKRKPILMAARMVYYFTTLVGVALVPMIFSASALRLALMCTMLSLGNVIWGLFIGGFADWELHFLPQDGTREEYYAYRNLIGSLTGVVTNLIAGVVASAIELLPEAEQLSWLFWLRIGGFIFILIDVLVFLRVKEYEYPKSGNVPNLKNVFTMSLKNKRFCRAIFTRDFMTLVNAITSSSLTYYLLDCGLGYGTQSFLAAIPPILSLLLTKPAVMLFRRMGCVKNLLLYHVVDAVGLIAYVMITPASVQWLYPAVYVVTQIVAVGKGIADTDFVFRFMPEEDRLNYHSFYYITHSFSAFIGAFIGAQYITLTEGRDFVILGMPFANVQLLMLAKAALFIIGIFLLASFRKELSKEEEIAA